MWTSRKAGPGRPCRRLSASFAPCAPCAPCAPLQQRRLEWRWSAFLKASSRCHLARTADRRLMQTAPGSVRALRRRPAAPSCAIRNHKCQPHQHPAATYPAIEVTQQLTWRQVAHINARYPAAICEAHSRQNEIVIMAARPTPTRKRQSACTLWLDMKRAKKARSAPAAKGRDCQSSAGAADCSRTWQASADTGRHSAAPAMAGWECEPHHCGRH